MITVALMTESNLYAIRLPRPGRPAPIWALWAAVLLAALGVTADLMLSPIVGLYALPCVSMALGVACFLWIWEVMRDERQ